MDFIISIVDYTVIVLVWVSLVLGLLVVFGYIIDKLLVGLSRYYPGMWLMMEFAYHYKDFKEWVKDKKRLENPRVKKEEPEPAADERLFDPSEMKKTVGERLARYQNLNITPDEIVREENSIRGEADWRLNQTTKDVLYKGEMKPDRKEEPELTVRPGPPYNPPKRDPNWEENRNKVPNQRHLIQDESEKQDIREQAKNQKFYFGCDNYEG